jgi:subtilase family serine protease
MRPWLEELECRNLLSASLPTVVNPPVLADSPAIASSIAGAVAYQQVVVQPAFTPPSYARPPYTPAEVSAAYGFNVTKLPNGQLATGAGQTIGIVDAYHDPNILSDVNTFSSQYGLPQFNTTGGPSFTQIQQNGVTQISPGGWSTEEALDVEWAHAMAPQASIVMVESQDNSLSNMFAAVTTAATSPGVSVVSMSWGASEFSGETSYDSIFQVPGVSFVAASGDNGARFGVGYPAASPYVLSVGGTTLNILNHSGNYSWASETGWSGSTGGKSVYESEPSYQKGVQNYGVRTNPDVSYNANPSTGVLVLDTLGGGYFQVGGTSAGAPQWAAMIALADQGRAINGAKPVGNAVADVYNLPSSDFHDITSGSNGKYSATKGYDLVTGLGSPKVNLVVPALYISATSPNAASPSTNGNKTPVSGGNTKVHPHDLTGDLSAPNPADPTTSTAAGSHALEALLSLAFAGRSAATTTESSQVDNVLLTRQPAAITGLGATAASPDAGPSQGLAFNTLGMTFRSSSDLPWAPSALAINNSGGDDDAAAAVVRPAVLDQSPDAMPADPGAPDTVAPGDADDPAE